MANYILMHNAVNGSKIKFEKPKPINNKGGAVWMGKVSYLGEDGPGKLFVQTPKMTTPFGISNNSQFCSEDISQRKYMIDLSFSGEDMNPDIAEFRKSIDRINGALKDYVVKHRDHWIVQPKKKKSPFTEEEIRDECFCSAIKEPAQKNVGKYADTFQIKIKYDVDKDGDISKDTPKGVEFYNSKGKEISAASVEKFGQCICLYEIVCTWVSRNTGEYGYLIRLAQLQYFKTKKLAGFSMIKTHENQAEDDDSESETALDEDELDITKPVDELSIEVDPYAEYGT